MLASRLIFIASTCSLVACAQDPSEGEGLTRDEAADNGGGKADGADICAAQGWYGDGYCDTFCTNPDADCADAIVLSHPHANGTYIVTKGTRVIVQLYDSNGSQGANWNVTAVDRTFGYPQEMRIGNFNQFTWKTDGFLDQSGRHEVEIALGAQGTASLATYRFAVDVRSGELTQ
jgi:hypothetical protein